MEPLVIAGLGNPGARYAGTRHNVGFAVTHRLVDRLKARPLPPAAAYAAWEAALPDGPTVRLVTPLLFMNRSGPALAEFGDRHGFEMASCLVVVDDVYLDVGRIRLRARGTAGGHNGLASIRDVFGGDEWPRLRIGVGRGETRVALADHVLAEFDEDERPTLDEALERSADAALAWAAEGITAAMNRFNLPAPDVRDNAPQGER